MGTHTTKLPQGGKTIYEVMHVRRWMRENYELVVSSVSNLVFMSSLPQQSHKRYFALLKHAIRKHDILLRQREFHESPIARMYMVYGAWVNQDLIKNILLRLEGVANHPAWSNFSLKDRVRFIAEFIFEGMLWCGSHRANLWRGKPSHDDPDFTFVDEWHAKHVFDCKDIPLASVFGYTPERDF